MKVRIVVPPGSRHEDIVAAIAALPWDERNALVGAAMCQWQLDYKGNPGFVVVGRPANPHPRRRAANAAWPPLRTEPPA